MDGNTEAGCRHNVAIDKQVYECEFSHSCKQIFTYMVHCLVQFS